MKNSKRRFWTAALSIAVIGLAVCVLPFRRNIDTVLKGEECRIGDEEYSKEISLLVKGTYNQYLIKSDTFEGTIEISGYDNTRDGYTASLDFRHGYSILFYYDNIDGLPIHNSFGLICCTPDFSQVLICINEPPEANSKGWGGDNGLYIAAPATNRNEAADIAEKLSGKSKWFSGVKW